MKLCVTVVHIRQVSLDNAGDYSVLLQGSKSLDTKSKEFYKVMGRFMPGIAVITWKVASLAVLRYRKAPNGSFGFYPFKNLPKPKTRS